MDPLYVEIGRRMRSLRAALKMTQAQVAEAAGIDSSFYGQLERGANVPSLKTLMTVAKALGAEPAALLPSQGTAGKPERLHGGAMESLLTDLPAGQQRFLLGVVREIAQELRHAKRA